MSTRCAPSVQSGCGCGCSSPATPPAVPCSAASQQARASWGQPAAAEAPQPPLLLTGWQTATAAWCGACAAPHTCIVVRSRDAECCCVTPTHELKSSTWCTEPRQHLLYPLLLHGNMHMGAAKPMHMNNMCSCCCCWCCLLSCLSRMPLTCPQSWHT